MLERSPTMKNPTAMFTMQKELAVNAHIDSGWLKKADADRSATNAEPSKKIVETVLRAI